MSPIVNPRRPNGAGNDWNVEPYDHRDHRLDARRTGPSVTITAFSSGPPSTGRMITRSTTAPRTKPPTSATASASQYDQPALDERQGDVRGRHRHRALGEVDDPGGPPDQHQGQRERGVDRALGQPVEGDVRNCCTNRSFLAGGVRLRSPGRRGGGRRRPRSVRGLVGDDDPAQRQHDADVGDGQRAAHVLLDQQHGQAPVCRAACAAAPMICAMTRGARPSDGSSSSSSRGLGQQRPAEDQHLPLAAGELVRRVLPALGQRREQLVHLGRCPAAVPRRSRAPQRRRGAGSRRRSAR